MIIRDQKDFEAALVDENAYIRVQARASDAIWMREFDAWLQEEIRRPDARPAALMQGLFATFMSIHASIAAEYLDSGGGEPACSLLKMMLDQCYVQLFKAFRERNAQERGAK